MLYAWTGRLKAAIAKTDAGADGGSHPSAGGAPASRGGDGLDPRPGRPHAHGHGLRGGHAPGDRRAARGRPEGVHGASAVDGTVLAVAAVAAGVRRAASWAVEISPSTAPARSRACSSRLCSSQHWDGRSAVAGARRDTTLLAVVLLALSPITYRALQLGHPEEPLGAALCVAAVLLACGGRHRTAGLTLGLAVATKQWALFAVLPVVLCVPRTRAVLLRLLVPAGLVAIAAYVPMLLADPGAFAQALQRPIAGLSAMRPVNLWHLTVTETRVVPIGSGEVTRTQLVPAWLQAVAHPGIAVVAVAVPLRGLARLRQRASSGSGARCCSSHWSSCCGAGWTRGTTATTTCPCSWRSAPTRSSTADARLSSLLPAARCCGCCSDVWRARSPAWPSTSLYLAWARATHGAG